uniref:TSA: Wollemia nobilis Ref_Wollemi_Transcript_11109_2259 transcribed RNA sequence n=1 Tax=Wollemia nobilis TaxID=56998 RepID=A0A0C9RMC7_9CONI
MASQQVPAVTPPAAVIGNVFVQQYYNVLHQSPALVHRFYNDSSKLGRPESNGEMSCITTLDAINEKILSLDYGEYKAEIKTVDSQESYNQGVTVLVTGALLGRDDVKRNFTQSFFLAPQDKGYFVLNDVFRFLDEPQQEETRTILVNGVADPVSQDCQSVAVVAEPTPTVVAEPAPTVVAEPAPAQELQAVEQSPQLEEETHVEEDDVSPSKNVEEGSAAEEEASPTQATEAPALPSGEKKSYASIVKVMKNSAAVQAPTVVRTAPINVERQAIVPTQTSSPPPPPPPNFPLSSPPKWSPPAPLSAFGTLFESDITSPSLPTLTLDRLESTPAISGEAITTLGFSADLESKFIWHLALCLRTLLLQWCLPLLDEIT